ncbi:phage repressor protein C with HTH and peptisase S24 domain [Methylopila capsulata]|uniref:DNA-binding protein n=1 Tax=Methylopila capsulata TaxID=61654 RepID=A0A9W6IRX0_9HYPH|nr:helix-turn-helix transcriptional regulator [Methylopila capsulata]MBM7851047.1 phage repressor protein C with HTH and peptisase S24 domain [Methylopila capsulata]GLK54105.1 DNA-binding protein [Methylopila capsulata]
MLGHGQIWAAIDALAAKNGLSASGLARRSGLDPTTFNRSKRIAADGRPRWPSTESIAKALDATATNLDSFMGLLTDGAAAPRRHVPLIGLAQAGEGGYFDDAGFPVGQGWDEIELPGADRENVYALEIAGDSMSPVYRDGDVVLVSPGAAVRRGDRVIVRTTGGEVLAKELARSTAKQVELRSINPAHPDRTLPTSEVAWIARIVWASQ